MKKVLTSLATIGVTISTVGLASPSNAAQFFYGLTGDSRPDVTLSAQQAEANFLANFDNIYVETFEEFETGTTAAGENVLNIDFQNGAEAVLTGGGAIRDAAFEGLQPISGNKYWSLTFAEEVQDSYTISFTQGQAAVGFYTTDMGDAGNNLFSLLLSYEDNSEQLVNLPHGTTNASEFYFGYLDPNRLLKSITFLANGPIRRDGFGLDNLTIANKEQVSTPVPEYSSVIALLGLAALGVGSMRKYRPQ